MTPLVPAFEENRDNLYELLEGTSIISSRTVITILISEACAGPEPRRACAGQTHDLNYKTSIVQYTPKHTSPSHLRVAVDFVNILYFISGNVPHCIVQILCRSGLVPASGFLVPSLASLPTPSPSAASSPSTCDTVSTISKKNQKFQPRDEAYLVYFLQATHAFR
jgi:hypothetical protein